MPLVEELAKRGHEVTVVTSNIKENVQDPNIVQIHTGNFVEQWTKNLSETSLSGEMPSMSFVSNSLGGFFEHNDKTFDLPEVQRVIAKDQKYDMIIVYVDFTCSETGYFLSQRFNAPLVLLSIFQASLSYVDWAMGQPNNPAYMALSSLPYISGEMTFFQRWINTMSMGAFTLFRNYVMIGQAEAILDKHFPDEDRIPLLDLEKHASLALSFSHPHLTDGWKPTMPNYVQIGMMLCNPIIGKFDKSDKIGQFLDQGPTILLSFGSVAKAHTMPKEKADMFLGLFEKLKPFQVIWKWENKDLDGKLPSNVMVSKWLPQQKILAHPNVKLFITHAGQSSFQESICHKTPMVAIPIWGDQLANGAEIEKLGIGVNLDYKTLSEAGLLENVQKVLGQKKYQDKINHLNEILTDEIDRPMDRAIWWMEHVLRHPKLYAGKAAVHRLSWAQYFLLDVIAFTVLIFALLITILWCACVRMCCCKSRKNDVKPKQS